MNLAEQLNPEQLAAVTAPDGPILVLAAAGTGKTRTLVYRVTHLVAQGVDPARILLLTFTNRASREMLERAQAVTGPGVGGVWGGTFHHMANRFLRRHADRIGFPNNYAILDRDDSRKLVSDAVKARNLRSRLFPSAGVLLGVFGSAANTETAVEDLVEERFAGHEVDTDGVLRVYRDYEKRKRELSAMDFDDLLVNCVRLFREAPQTLAQYQERFLHVLVDEYQDTNTLQAELVDRLAALHRNVMVVGDDFQSIYSWRGADFRNILSFPERYADARIFKLETNYRSVPEILEVANACIAGNPEQFQKRLAATREPHRIPRMVRLRDGDHQAAHVVEAVRGMLREGYRPSDIAVLYRAHFHAMELERVLPRAQLPYIITSGVRFFEQAHIKDVCSILKVLTGPSDRLAFSRLLELFPGVGPGTVNRVWEKLGHRFDAASADARGTVRGMLRPAGRECWAAVEPILAAYGEEKLQSEPGEALLRFVKVFYEDYAVNTFENADRRLDDVGALILDTAKFADTEQFLSDIALMTNLDAEADARDAPRDECLRLSTVHQAKGLEWPVVIMLWLADGMFPSTRSLNESAEGESEERRLFYVAVTRAKDELVLCCPELRRSREGGIIPYRPSRFVEELPRGLVEVGYPACV